MKKLKTKSTALGLFAAAFVSSVAIAETLQYPFVAPKCPYTFRMPPNQADVYFSEDCKTVFIMPDRVGELKISDLSPTANLKRCGSLEKAYQAQDVLQDHILALSNRLSTTPIENEKARAYIHKEIATIKASIPEMIESYEKVLGGYLQVRFATSDLRDRMGQFISDNFQTLKDYDVNVSKMPISDSYISFRAKPISEEQASGRAVIDHSIPGVGTPDADGKAAVEHTKMNGSLSGQVVLSLIGACPHVADKKAEKAPLLVANMTYKVPVLTIAGYKASLDNKFAIDTLMRAWQTKTHLSVGDTASILMKGDGVAQGYKFETYNVELPAVFTAQDRASFFETQRLNALTRLTANLIKQMQLVGFVDLERPAGSATAPAPGYIDEIRSGRSCSSKGPWGMFGSSCSNYSYTVKIPAASSASSVTERIVDTKFTNVEESASRETIFRVYTMAFETKKESN